MALDYKTYAEAKAKFTFEERWAVFSGNKEHFNIAYECIDRHPKGDEALRIKFDDGRREVYTFADLSRLTSQFAHFLVRRGIGEGERVALILNPSLEFYVTFFGILKRGAVAVPCFPAFGPDAIEYRLRKSDAKMVVTYQEKASSISVSSAYQTVMADELKGLLQAEDEEFVTNTAADTLAVMQFSSGTTGTPKIVPYRHAAATLTALNMKMVIGLRKNDRYFCPSSPAWGHGIWYGSVGPVIFGNAIGAYSGKFKAGTFLEALEEFGITNVSGTPLIYRLVRESGRIGDYKLKLRDLSFTGGPLDVETILYFREKLGVAPRSFFGSTEVGVVVLEFPFDDWVQKPGSLGGPMPGLEVAVLDEAGNPLPPGQIGHIALKLKDRWVRTGDAAYVDEDGRYWHKGRADDIIISAGWTIGPQEVEEALAKHPAVQRAAVVGSPDPERGEIVKAFIVTDRVPGEELKRDIQDFIRTRLSRHEYPREIEFVEQLPETPDGKIKRSELRARERARKGTG
ncbi:MAG TPA: AMP-binding protein [Dehalococcoidia bacterium]|nr:AMP-binding protein [Dehalococcoidia bacterium]